MADDTITQADIDKAIKQALAKQREEFDAETVGLKEKNRELLGKLREAQGVKPEDLQAAEARADKAEAALAEAQKAVKDLTVRAEKAEKAVEAEAGFTSKLLTENALNTALAEAGVTNPAFLKTLKATFAGDAAVVAEGDQRVVKLGDKALADAIKEWAGTDEAKHFITAPGSRGGGAPGGGAGGGAGVKTMTRSEFDGLDQGSRAAFFKEGGKVVDQAA